MAKTINIIWPVNPTDTEVGSERALKTFFQQMQKLGDLKIQPVTVISAAYFTTSYYFEPINIDELRKNLLSECATYLKKFEGLPLEPVQVLENQFASQGAEVAAFNDFVEKAKADFVVMTSHGRKGWSRTFLGSFTESFLLSATSPVIVMGPHCGETKNLKRALMPVDLSEASKAFVEKFLDDHRLEFVEDLKLFHKISMIDLEDIAWAPSLYGLGAVDQVDVMAQARKASSHYLEALLTHPLAQKRLSFEISERMDSVAQVLIDETKTGRFDLLVMRSEAGPWAARFLGSVTQAVIRDSVKPVVVYPHYFKA